jgi:hypothetical protein
MPKQKRYLTPSEVLLKLAVDHWEHMGYTKQDIKELTGFSTPNQKRAYYRAVGYFFNGRTKQNAEVDLWKE